MLRPLLLLALLTAPAAAQTLRVGMAAETSSADPHNYAMAPNSTLRDNLFEALTDTDPAGRVRPGLAESWSRDDDRTWRFRLRKDVRFSDGSPFGAPDVVATFCRILSNPEEQVSSFSHSVRRLAAVEAEGEEALVIRTRQPEPALLSDLAGLAVLPRRLMPEGVRFDAAASCGGGPGWPGVADFNAGRAAIGTGPFKLERYERGGTIVLTRNPRFHGPAPAWTEVRLTPIPQPTARLAALLAGDQDLIEAPGTADIPRIRAEPRLALSQAPTWRLLFLQLDTARDPSPFVPGRNALRDARVRHALSLALNRPALVDRIMDGVALPAAQFMPDGSAGTVGDRTLPPYDPARARALLAEAGFPAGFAMTLHATNNRYVNDGPLAQAIVQQWQRIGVRAELEAMPGVTFFPRRGRREFSAALGGWATSAPETLGFFTTWLTTADPAMGFGTSNYGGWSDAPFDRAVREAAVTMDDTRRAALLREASERALAELPVIPLHFESAVWASRRGVSYPGRSDQTTRAAEVENK